MRTIAHVMFAPAPPGFSYFGTGAVGSRFSAAGEESEADEEGRGEVITAWEPGYALAIPGMLCGVLLLLLVGCVLGRAVHREEFAHVGAGGAGWQVAWTLVLPKSFFDGQSPQGVTGLPGGGRLVFSGKNVLRVTADEFPFASEGLLRDALPAHLLAAGFTHMGDLAAAESEGQSLLFVPVEDEPKTTAGILTLRFPDFTLHDSCHLPQDHAPVVAVDPVSMVAYTSVFRGVSHINRYQMPGCRPLPPLVLRQGGNPVSLSAVQGASVHNGTLYLSTNQVASNGGDIFALSQETGEISLAMTLRVGGGQAEMEGLDVRADDRGLRMLVLMNYYSNPVLLQLRPR